ncbi:MAG: class I SAM-dependent methyltransferase [Phycisphaerales bacterium]|nr:class I SAM-dependent methyltransferase [Phycisphaerales bacterium]
MSDATEPGDVRAVSNKSAVRGGGGLIKPHWTVRYMLAKWRLGRYQRSHPEEPWLTPTMVCFLDGWLRPTDVMVEFGSGRSTAWFARRVGRLISVEHHQGWHSQVNEKLKAEGLDRNVTYTLAPNEPTGYVAAAATGLGGSKADVVLVDGNHRWACATWALGVVKPGGLIVIDDAQRYLRSRFDTPPAFGTHPELQRPEWGEFTERTRGWRRSCTTSGVTDTVALVAPIED